MRNTVAVNRERRPLDNVDRQILAVLQTKGRIPNTELAAAVRLSPAPCLRRVQRLEEDGYIRGYVALLDADAVGRGLTVFVSVSLERQTKAAVDRFEAEILKYPEVLECYWTAGDTDYLLKVAVADLTGLERFLLDRLTQVPGVASVKSGVTMRQVKSSTALPVA